MSTDVLGQCAYCPRLCQDVCPAVRAERRETVSPTAILTALLLEREGRLEGGSALWELATHCIMCGRCTEICLHDATPWAVMLDARRRLELPAGRTVALAEHTLWAPAPFGELGSGDEHWLLLGSFDGLDHQDVLAVLADDTRHKWHLPQEGLPQLLYRAWACGETDIFEQYAVAIRDDLRRRQPAGVAWSDPHEGKAVEALLDHIGFFRKRGYAPMLVGRVPEAQTGCGDVTRRWGCCGGAGGYPQAAPEAAAELANRYEGDVTLPLPGVCVAHLRRHGRADFISDWTQA